MRTALLLFPHQLFRDNLTLSRHKLVVLVEHALYFRQYRFHRQKLVLHRASMRAHQAWLQARHIETHYVENIAGTDMAGVLRDLQAREVEQVHYIDPVDDWLERDLLQAAANQQVSLKRHPTPMFITPEQDLRTFLGDRKRFSMAAFYAAQRQHHGVLMQGNEPLGERWSFDDQNRKRLAKGIELPLPWTPPENAFVTEARDYVLRNFPDHPGLVENFHYAVTHADAECWLEDFLQHRFARFGPYEDAIAADASVLFHSNISHALNIGLLTPDQLLQRVLEFGQAEDIPLNSLEGYVRQVLGWREYMRAAYVLRGRRIRSCNFWQHQRMLPQAFYTGTTGVTPIDTVIGRVLQHAYAHHIERLMLLANFMQLCEIDPHHIYQWFMEMFIDAYDWVMVPNVYAMALFADGGTMTTKPYISGSNYVLKMSDFKRGDWCATWDGLFWSFMHRHSDFFAGNQRLNMLLTHLRRMPAEDLAGHKRRAETFLRTFTA